MVSNKTNNPMKGIRTKAKKRLLLKMLGEERGNVKRACARVPVNRSTFYCWLSDEDFRDGVEKARAILPLPQAPVSSKVKGLGYVYIVSMDNHHFYKIGISRKPPHIRLSSLQCGNPYQLRIEAIIHCVDYALLEKRLHQMFIDRKVIGEWYGLSKDELQTAIDFARAEAKKQPQIKLAI